MYLSWSRQLEAVFQRCSWEKVLWKYAANLQENTHVEVWFQSNFIEITFRHGCSPVDLLYIFRTPLKNTTGRVLLNDTVYSTYIRFPWLQEPETEKHCFFFEDMLQRRKTSKLLKFCSISFHFALFSFYFTGFLKKHVGF